jgi:uncharacterized protein (TIGR03437 family)
VTNLSHFSPFFSKQALHNERHGFPSAAVRLLLCFLVLVCLTSVSSAQISVDPINIVVSEAAGSEGFAVSVPGGVEWTLTVLPGINTPDVSWITVTSATTQTGSGSVTFDYTENTSLFPRTALFYARRTDTNEEAELRFVQDVPESEATVDPTSITIDGFGGDRSISVTVGPQVPWLATTNQSWIQILTGATTGSGTLNVKILPNFTGNPRNGIITVLNATITVVQDFEDVTFTVGGGGSANFPFEGGQGSVPVTVNNPLAPWEASSNDAFITITNAGSYTGTATVTYSVALNPDESPRTGTMTIAGQTFTVNQEANPGEPPGELSSTLNNLSFLFIPDRTSTTTREITVSSTGDPLNFTVQILDAPWLSVDQNSATTPASLVFNATASQLAVGNYSGSVRLTPSGGGAALVIPVSLEVRSAVDPLPLLNANPRSLYFNRISGAPPPPPQRIRLGNPGAVLNPQVEVAPQVWLNVQFVNDAQGPSVVASIRNVNLLPGIYETSIKVKSGTSAFAELEIPVRHVVLLSGGSGPSINSGGVVNGATFRAGGAPGTWISIFGSNLANAIQGWNPSTVPGSMLPTQLAGAEVFISGVRAPISFASPSQVNALVPNVPERGWVPVEVRVNNQPTEGGFIYLRDADPAFFVYSPQGGIFPAAQHPDAVAVGPANLFPGGPPSRPAAPVGTIVLYGTGFGETLPAVDPGTFFQGAAPLLKPEDVRVRVGNLNAQIQFVGLVAPGLYQINVVLPGLVEGDYFLNSVIRGLTTQPGLVMLIRN